MMNYTGIVTQRQSPKYQQIVDTIREDIARARYAPSEKIPSDQELSDRFGTSRLTVIRALRQLADEGLVRRRAGSGTFVAPKGTSEVADPLASHTFGLLIPDLGEGEIFEPICQGMARAGQSAHQALLWGNTSASDKRQQAVELCRFFIQKKVDGVFFAPLELAPDKDEVNNQIAHSLEKAGIPVVLLDRCYENFPERSRFDLVGIDNRRAGFQMTDHLLRQGCRKLAFVLRPGSAATVEARVTGFLEAHWRRSLRVADQAVLRVDLTSAAAFRLWLDEYQPDGVVCANDYTAALVMQILGPLGIRIPSDLRIVGFDDVKYASLLPVPLTTLRQPCQEIGAAAVTAMLQRLSRPDTATRDILLPCELIVRQSCGSENTGTQSDRTRSAELSDWDKPATVP
jgi:GntR family transcriptional regulator, arabinose operon transcriptional repressor